MDVLMTELFRTDIGLLSLFTILFIIGMSVFFVIFFPQEGGAGHGRTRAPAAPGQVLLSTWSASGPKRSLVYWRHAAGPAGLLLSAFQPTSRGSLMFPEYRDLISKLKTEDARFERLFDKHNDMDQKIKNMEARLEPATDIEIEVLKKEKLALKDELYQILRKADAAEA